MAHPRRRGTRPLSNREVGRQSLLLGTELRRERAVFSPGLPLLVRGRARLQFTQLNRIVEGL